MIIIVNDNNLLIFKIRDKEKAIVAFVQMPYQRLILTFTKIMQLAVNVIIQRIKKVRNYF
jgi:hypothetical protein